MIPMIPPNLTPDRRALWWEALRLQDGDPDMPVGIRPLARAAGMHWCRARRIIGNMRAAGLWPFPPAGRGGVHATAAHGDGTKKRRRAS